MTPPPRATRRRVLALLQPIGIAILGGCRDDTTNGARGSDPIGTRETDSVGGSGSDSDGTPTRTCAPAVDHTDSETVEVFFAGVGPRNVTLTVTADGDERFSETRTLADGVDLSVGRHAVLGPDEPPRC